MTFGSIPAFSKMRTRKQWFKEGKNWEISKAKVLVALPFTHPERTMWVSAMLASEVDLNLRPPSWLRCMKLLEATENWSHLAITFSMSLPRVLRRTIGRNTFRLSYDCLFGLGMIIVVDILKWFGQCPRLMQASVMLMTFERQASFLTMVFQWRQVSLSGPDAEESAQLLIADKNSNLEKGPQLWGSLWSSSLRISMLTWWWSAVLNVLCKAVHRFSGVRHGRLLCLMASIAGSFLFLTQFINSHGPRLLFAIS